MKNLFSLLMIVIFLSACNGPGKENKKQRDYIKTETASEENERMQWWRDAGFGMFIHWGLYSIPAGEYGDEKNHAEWIQETANIPVEEYEKYAQQFNPINYNANEWVRMAKDAGMKYIVITSKHHDGFCLWNSAVSQYDMEFTPYKKDLLKDLAEACKKEDIVLCFYHSIMDWHHPDAQGVNFPDYNHGTGPNPQFPQYATHYLYPQLKELLTNYGEVGVLWFDGEWITEWTEEQGKELYNYLRTIQPNLIINNRVGKGRQGMEGMNAYEDAAGDFGTPEQEILDGTSTLDWESCMTMNDHWGFNQFDNNFKSSTMLIHNLIDIAAKGGNYLLNIGPKADGRFPDQSIERLKEIGDWMDVNGEVIHNSRGCNHYKESEQVYYIQNKSGTSLYAVLTEWPGQSIQLKYAQPDKNSKIRLLGYPEELAWENQAEAGIIIHLPKSWQNAANRKVKHAWVIKIKGQQAKVANAPEVLINENHITEKALFSEQTTVKLNSSTDGANIYYTLDNSKPNKESTLYTQAIQLNNSTTIRALAVKKNYISSLETKVHLIKTEAFHAVQFKVPFSNKYPALGNFTIGDGVFGQDDNYTENWLGFEGEDLDVTIDLGKIKKAGTLKIDFLENIKSWIFLPETIEISHSIDGKDFTPIKTMKIEKPNSERKAKSHLFELNFPEKQLRFVQIKAKNIGICPNWHPGNGSKAWLFVDEVIVE